jgi:hypothetical protein
VAFWSVEDRIFKQYEEPPAVKGALGAIRAEFSVAGDPIKETDKAGWILLPANARRRWKNLLDRQKEFEACLINSAVLVA